MTWPPEFGVTRRFLWSVDFLCSHDGKPSHPKLVVWAVLGCFALNRPLPVVVVICLVSASFGLKAYLMFLQHNATTAASTDTTTRTIVEHVQARRDPVDGIEATE